jgi:hypothetical protein
MSEPLRIALISEGPIDFEVINAALKAVLGSREFFLNPLPPENTRPDLGGGWCRVLRWCREVADRGSPSLEQDLILQGFDLFVLHLDADVAGMTYEAGGAAVVQAAQGLLSLPCEEPCPPASASVQALRSRLLSWLGMQQIGGRTVLCIPSKMTEAWLAAAVLPEKHKLLSGIECNANLAVQLSALPKQNRIKKNLREYRNRSDELTRQWDRVEQTCTQAAQFAFDVKAALETSACIVEPAPVEQAAPHAPNVSTPELSISADSATEVAKPVELEIAIELMIVAEAAESTGELLIEPVSSVVESSVPDQGDDPSTN